MLPSDLKLKLEKFVESGHPNTDPLILQVMLEVPKIQSSSFLNQLSDTNTQQFYFSRPDVGFSLLAIGSILEDHFSGSARFRDAEQFYHLWRDKTQFISKDDHVESSSQFFMLQSTFFPEISERAWSGFHPVSLYIPEYIIQVENEKTTLSINTFFETRDTLSGSIQKTEQRVAEVLTQIDKLDDQVYAEKQIPQITQNPVNFNHWTHLVRHGVHAIREKQFEKVVLSTQMQIHSSLDFDVYHIVGCLEANYPNCTTFLVRNENGKTFLGATPEEFAQVKNGLLHCDALAGSIKRGDSEFEDRQFERALLQSTKDRAEHQYVAEFVRKTLEPLVSNLSFPKVPELLKLQNVQHLYTPFEGTLRGDTSLFRVIENLHPTPAVGGIPVKPAAEFIAKNEIYERGCYASPLGFLTSDGEMDLVVGLRSGLFDGNQATLYAGAGIVEDSDPSNEYDEIMMKFQPMLNAIQPQDLHAESLQS